MTHVFHRQARGEMPIAVAGKGIYITDSQGKRYLDASGGAAVSCLGHNDADVIAAIKDQIDSLPFAHTGFFTSPPAEELADRLIKSAPEGIEMVYFLSGGSEAVEAAIKMARQYFVEIGEPKRTRFISRRQSYHGNTLGALAVGGNLLRREPYREMLMDCGRISACYAYREQGDGESEVEYGLRVADELEAEILRLGPDSVAAFIAETVGGATAGVLPPVEGYFKRIREICDNYGVLLILDEVMCGMGRTGTLFACEQDGIAPDIVCIAKGLGAGYQPIGATLVSGRVFEAFRSGSGVFLHGHTYMGHPTACAAALAVQKKIEALDLLANVRKQGDILVDKLHARLGNHPNVGNIRGRGLFRAIELVADRASKEPLDPALKVHVRVKNQAMERGLICYPGGGTVDGKRGDHILLAPPYIIEEAEVGELVNRLGDAIDAALMDAGVQGTL
jgi:adenosylmethionine-8-amino-7-oxononanoate aminotransferase